MSLNLPPSPLVERLLTFDVTDSTNTQARQLVNSGSLWQNTLVVADYQTAGRGRLDRQWAAPPGTALLATLVLPAGQVSPAAAVLTLSMALCRTLRDLKVGATIKYPNDVVCEGRKLGGILAETVTDPLGRTALLLGFGVNLSQSLEDFPPELPYAASSIALETGERPSRERVLSAILGFLDSLLAADQATAVADYKSFCSTLGASVSVETSSGLITGIATDVDADGCLILSLPDETTRRLHSAEIVRIHNL